MSQTITDLPFRKALPDRPFLPGKRVWQAGFLVLALIPATSAVLAMAVGVARFLDDDVDVALDSTYRYFGGVYLGVALLALWCLPRIEERANALVLATGAIFLGGIGRLISIADVGAPSTVTWFVLIIELGALFLALAMRGRIRPAPGESAASAA
ncbi:MAG: DUF4345 domain-containing protein [Actinomycetota bacterium]